MMARRTVAYGVAGTALVALAAFLRFDGLGDPSFWLDEILGQLYVEQARNDVRWWQWLTGFHPEHGPLYYASELISRDEWTARLPPALFGLASVIVTWFAARCATRNELAALCAAVLVAISPLHVYYSREARPYGLIFLLTSAILVAVLRRSVAGAAVILALMLYTSTATASVVATAAIAAAAAWLAKGDASAKRGLGVIAVLSSVAAPLFLVLYEPGGAGEPLVRFPEINAGFFDRMVRGMFVTVLDAHAGGHTAYALLLLSIIGAIHVLRRRRVEGIIVVAFAVLPATLSVITLLIIDHWYAVRYISPSVIALLMLAGSGVAAVGEGVAWLVARRRPRLSAVVRAVFTTAILGAIAGEVWPMARREPHRKFDWEGLTTVLLKTARPGDLIITAEPWSEQALRYYARGARSDVTIVRAVSPANAEELSQRFPASWLVTGGWSIDPSVRNWMCSQPLLLASAIEGVRVHYAPSAQHFLRTRAAPLDLRVAAVAAGADALTIRLGERDEVFLGDGWALREGQEGASFRWAVSERATLGVPLGAARDRRVQIHVLPHHHPSLPPQTLQLLVNGQAMEPIALQPGWRHYSISTPAAAWREGWNDLAFLSGRTAVPAALDATSKDDRTLAVAFQTVAIGESELSDEQRATTPVHFTPRLASAAHMQDAFWNDHDVERFPPSRLRREAIEPFLARLGFDPVRTWPRVASGEMTIEDLVEVAAYGSDCVGEAAFLARVGETLLDRPLSSGEVENLQHEMDEHGYSRSRMAVYIARSDEFRESILRP